MFSPLYVANIETFGRNLIVMKLAIDVRVLFYQVIFMECKLSNYCFQTLQISGILFSP